MGRQTRFFHALTQQHGRDARYYIVHPLAP
nr:MAG TPA: hypothetical protein [Caudoviricetes sp.]